jgi:hypothetical protein
MDEFLVFLAGLPSIALSAIFGGLFGLVGGLLGVILKRWGLRMRGGTRLGLRLRFLSP